MFNRNEFLKWANNAQQQNVEGADYHKSNVHGYLKDACVQPEKKKKTKQLMDESWMPLKPNSKQTRGVRKNIRENIEQKQTESVDESTAGRKALTRLKGKYEYGTEPKISKREYQKRKKAGLKKAARVGDDVFADAPGAGRNPVAQTFKRERPSRPWVQESQD